MARAGQGSRGLAGEGRETIAHRAEVLGAQDERAFGRQGVEHLPGGPGPMRQEAPRHVGQTGSARFRRRDLLPVEAAQEHLSIVPLPGGRRLAALAEAVVHAQQLPQVALEPSIRGAHRQEEPGVVTQVDEHVAGQVEKAGRVHLQGALPVAPDHAGA